MKTLDFKIGRKRRNDETGEMEFKTLCHHKGNSSTQSNPTTTTTTDLTDQRVAASEGSISAGAGANVNVQSTDPEAFDAITRIAASANDTSEKTATAAISGNVGVANAALNSNVKAVDLAVGLGGEALDLGKSAISAVSTGQRDALDFSSDIVHQTLGAAIQSQQSANELVRDTNENFVAKLASNAGEAPTALAGETVKYIAVGAVAVVLGLVLLRNNSK